MFHRRWGTLVGVIIQPFCFTTFAENRCGGGFQKGREAFNIFCIIIKNNVYSVQENEKEL
jgi:hypothetical protein